MSWSVSIYKRACSAAKKIAPEMISRHAITVLGCALVMGTAMLQPANAEPIKRQADITFAAPVALPDQVIQAGTYRFTLLSPDVVQVTNNTGRVIGTYMAISADRVNPASTEVVLEERSGRSERAVSEWFFEGDALGVSFVYHSNPNGAEAY